MGGYGWCNPVYQHAEAEPTINVELFGRETPVEVGFTELRKCNSKWEGRYMFPCHHHNGRSEISEMAKK